MRRALLAFVVIALAAVACGDDDAATTTAVSTTQAPATALAAEPGVVISIENFAFSQPVTAAVGETVTIRNIDGVVHTWTSPQRLFASGDIAGSGEFTHVFEEAGTFAFFCERHPTMVGEITIEG